MAGFNFEKNLEHQTQAVESTVGVFEGLEIIKPSEIYKNHINPILDKDKGFSYVHNIGGIQERNSIDRNVKGKSNIIDIMMETGTGKTYTYTKTIFELNALYGVNKFIVVVPTLSIKAGTINFLKSDSSREHFMQQYGKTLKLHIVESQKGSKKKKSVFPSAVTSFVNAGNFDTSKIQVLIINAGMINSDTMTKTFDTSLFDTYGVPFEAISAIKPFIIVDEPHKFAQGNKTWINIQQMNPQYILRYGATFLENTYENLVYTLSSVDSFNRNLVKGVIGHITEFESGKNAIIKLISTDGKEARLELNENNNKKSFTLSKKESLEKIHSQMQDVFIENLNKTTVILSNGLELKRGDKLNPYSYSETLGETMIAKTVKNHFKLEKELLTRDVKIKPLTLFFIDNIEEYREKDGYIKKTVEKYIRAEIKELLKTETSTFYKEYLELSLKNISATHGGYFSKDNSEKDEAIENEVNEILHDKQKMLNLNNPRRFIFSKWTLREGWDNPNVFQICKLRSSGSETSKLQEVGRGLRLPVNEYGNRVKDEQFYLDYFVDFTEADFIDKLIGEINEKSGALSKESDPEKLDDVMIIKICEKYPVTEDDLLENLDNEGVINRKNEFKEGGFDYIKKNYPLIFEGIDSNKIRKSTDIKKQIHVRTEKYADLKILWEKLNEKVLLEYKIPEEGDFKNIFIDFLLNQKMSFNSSSVKEKKVKISIEDNKAVSIEYIVDSKDILQISTMSYSDFIKSLSESLKINIKTLHQSILESGIEINDFLNSTTIRLIKNKFNSYLMHNAINKFSIEYKKVGNSIHPTKLTDNQGKIKNTISATDVGVHSGEESVAGNYFFDELFYDSELEKENIQKNLNEVIVFTKIPKNSIKIPVSGGKSYSPDFAYVLNYKDGEEKLYFVVETKNADDESLRPEEAQKIKHAELLFKNSIKIKFRKQFKSESIKGLIEKITSED